ncbi:MAG: hypothetical protein ACRDAU_00055 [Clostridium sp.]
MNIITTIITFVVLLAITIGILFVCKQYVFPKVRVNKFIPLAVAIILFLIQLTGRVTETWFGLISTPLIIIAFLWFLDIQQTGGPKAKAKVIKNKPKAKPNRVKNMKNEKNPKA